MVQPRKTRPCLTEKFLMGRKELNQTNKLNELRKSGKIRGLPSILSLFRDVFNKFIKT